MNGYTPLVHVRRGEHTESVHSGAIVVADAEGNVLHAIGDPATATFLRSSAKPIQVIPLLESGAADHFRLIPKEIAIAIASHGAQSFHLEAVRGIFAKTGLSEEFLMCGTHEPTNRKVAKQLQEEGRQATAIYSNCSGKHAGMLALALFRGYPTEGYFRLDHPVQEEMLAVVSDFTRVPAEEIRIAVDGCSLPTFGVSLQSAAGAFARLMEPESFSHARREAVHRAVTAMRTHPEMIGGDGSIDSDLMREAGLDVIAKIGAEGYFGIGYRRDGKGYGVAFKIADGSMGRARNAVALEIARQLGLVPPDRLARMASEYLPAVNNNRGSIVGNVQAEFSLS